MLGLGLVSGFTTISTFYTFDNLHRCHTRQNIVVYARMLTYNDGVLWPQNLGTIAIANYTFI